jgi:hypothetical protein
VLTYPGGITIPAPAAAMDFDLQSTDIEKKHT